MPVSEQTPLSSAGANVRSEAFSTSRAGLRKDPDVVFSFRRRVSGMATDAEEKLMGLENQPEREAFAR